MASASRSIKRKRVLVDKFSLAAVAYEGRWDDVLAMIESSTMANIDLNGVSELGRTALWLGANEGHAAAVKVLLQAGADVNKADDDGFAPLSVAASAPIAKMLIERGADLNATNTFGQTALWRAVEDGDRAGVVEALLQAGADVNKADDDGDPPLPFATTATIVTMLIERGASVNAVNTFGRTALWRPVEEGRAGVVQALLQAGAAVNKADDDGDPPLSFAATAAIATMLIERGADVSTANKRGETALWSAVKDGRAGVVEVLLQAGADVHKADKECTAALSVAASAPIAAMLIERGADVNAANKRGESALWRAAKGCRADVVDALLQAGADVSKADKEGSAALSVAASATIATMLIERGADVHATNERGETALLLAVQDENYLADVVEALVQAGADVNKADTSGRLPLPLAADERHWSCVTLLVRSNRIANVDALDSDGKTALWMALDEPEESYMAEAREAAAALICAGADVDFQWSGESLLRSVAQSWGSADNVLLLLAAGAATTGVSAADCYNLDVMALMMAAGVVWTELEIEQAIRRCGVTRSEVSAAKKRIEKFRFEAIRSRVLEICIALQSLEIPAPQLIEIVTQACAPFAAQLPYHYLWDAVVLAKHFHRRAAK
jgi:cytohesin